LGIAWPIVALLLVTLGASPSFALTATTNIQSFMALLLLATALDGFVRFTLRGHTHGGFQAGLAIGLASLCAPAASVCAAGFAAAAPLLVGDRFRGARAAGRATAAVLLFPTVAALAGWTFVTWRFSGDAMGWLHAAAPAVGFRGGTGASMSSALRHLLRPLAMTPIYPAALLLLLLRRQGVAAVAVLLPPLTVLVSLWIGLPFPGLSIAVLLGVVGLAAMPARPTRFELTFMSAVGVSGLVLKWVLASGPALTAWEYAVRH
jgi:hypothetical protein